MQPASTNGGGGSTNGMATAWGRFTSCRQRLTGSIGGTAASLAYDPAMRLYQLTGAATARFGYDPGSGDRSVARLGSNNLNRNMDGRSDNESAGESRRELVHCHRNPNAIGGVVSQLERGGYDSSRLSSATLGALASIGIAGGSVRFDPRSGNIEGSTKVMETGSRLPQVRTSIICNVNSKEGC